MDITYPPSKRVNLEVNVLWKSNYKVLYLKAVFQDFQCQLLYGLNIDQLRGLVPQ